MKKSMGIAECCQIMRDNDISVSEPIFTGMIQAGSFPAWRCRPLTPRALLR